MLARLRVPLMISVIALTGVALAGLIRADVALAMALVWIATIWMAAPVDDINAHHRRHAQPSVQEVANFVEPIDVPLMIVGQGRVLIANAAARQAFGQHIVGQDPRVALRHPDAYPLVAGHVAGPITIQGLTTRLSQWLVDRFPLDGGLALIQLTDRSTEADTSRAHTDFVANASHELRTPLAAILGYAETLADDPALGGSGGALDPATRARFIGTVHREGTRMERLVSDLMSLSRIESERHQAPTAVVELNAAVREVATSMRSDDTVAHRLVIEGDGTAHAPIQGDAAQVEQLIRNLVENGLRYGDPDTPVRVRVADSAAHFVLTVTDEGPGIAPEHVPFLTRRFYRTDAGRSRASGGTGLGLAIVKHIVERHKGTLDIDSVVGQGTTVTVRFPKP